MIIPSYGRRAALCLALLALAVAACSAQETQTPTFEDILNLKSAGSITISPDLSM